MSVPAPSFELLRPPGLSARRSLEVSGAWFGELCLWLRCRIGELGVVGWPMILIPEVVDRRFRLPETALQTYQRVKWNSTIPRAAFDIEARVGWVSARGSSVEIGLRSSALLDGTEVAESLLVTRSLGEAGSWGERDAPAVPDTGRLERRRSLVIDENQVRQFAELAGTSYPIHLDERYAWSQGYPSILVQGLVLLLVSLYITGASAPDVQGAAEGQAEMWFRGAVPAGSLLELCQSVDDPSVWAYRLVGTGTIAAVARLDTPASLSPVSRSRKFE